MDSRPLLLAVLLGLSALPIFAMDPPKVLDPALKLEALCTAPDIEAPTTVVGAPDGSFYVGCDPRDTRLNTEKPECYIVRFGEYDSPDQIRLPDGTFAPPNPPRRHRTIFAKDIFSPAGSAWHEGWLYVCHNPFLTRFKDTDGDGIADVREELITNLGMQPSTGLNDHCASGFTLGMDGFFYMSIGDRGTFQTKSVKDGSTISMQGGGIIRFRPDGTALEIFSTGTRNHLAVLLDGEDNAFTLDNTDDGNGWWTRLTHHIEGGYYGYPYDYQRAPNYGVTQPSKETLDAIKRNGHSDPSTFKFPLSTFLPAMADFGGGSPTGGLCYLSDGLPEQYRGKLLFSEWGKGGLFVIEVVRDGATFRFVKNTPLIQGGNGIDFRPMQLSVAADGSLLIADWQWGGWKGPKTVGTIWRLSWPEAHPAPRLKDESKATVEELLAALGHPDRDQRLRAQFVLTRRREAALDSLYEIVGKMDAPRTQYIHSMWALAGVPGVMSEDMHVDGPFPTQESIDVCNRFLSVARNRPELRSQAVSILNRGGAGALLFLFSGLKRESPLAPTAGEIKSLRLAALADPDPQVRLTTVLSTRNVFAQMTALTRLLDDDDAWVRFASTVVCAKEILPYVDYGRGGMTWLEQLPCTDRMAGALSLFPLLSHQKASKAIVNWFGRHVRDPDSPTVRIRAITALARITYQPKPWDGHWWGTQPVKNPPPLPSVAWEGTAKAVETLTATLADTDSSVRLAAAQAFANFLLDDAGKPAAASALRARLTVETDPAIRRQLIESLGVQKDPQAMEVFRQIALEEKADTEFRETAIAAVVNIGGDDARKTIAQLVSAQLSPAATRKIIQAAGELKVLEAAPVLIAHLSDENAGDRESAIKSLARLGPKSGALDALLVLLADKDAKVQTAAVEALGSFKDQRALPAILDFSKTKRARRETINAIAALMPDTQALPFLVDALREKGGGERRAALTALKKMRAEAWPLIEENLASGRIPAEFAPEIRVAFDSGVIAKWKLIGPFENVWEAVHPPETDALAGGDFLKRKTLNAEGNETGWNDVSASADEGRVDLGKVFKTSGMVCAYAFTEIESPENADAKLLCGSDDQIAAWLNGKKLHNSGPGSRGFTADQDEVPIHLTKGRNALLVKIGNIGGGWEFAARIPGVDGGKFVPTKEPAPDAKQRASSLATKPDGSWQNPGNAKRGEKLFFDQTAALGGLCATCHAVRGKGGTVGPDLSAIAVNYRRPDLVVSILEPSKTIALGFDQNAIETNGGETFLGALRQETADAFTLVGADAQPHVIKKTDVKTRKTIEQSLMPPGLTLGLKPEDFADLLAYLETLK